MLLRPPPLVSSLTFLLAFLIPLAGAVKFELIAEHHPKPSESASTPIQPTFPRRCDVDQADAAQNGELEMELGLELELELRMPTSASKGSTLQLTPHVFSIWNFAGAKSLVIVTANSPTSDGQRVDIEILDGSERGNVYLSKKVGGSSRRVFSLLVESALLGEL
jgi:hypothetical protein